jgi:hypothetical protein
MMGFYTFLCQYNVNIYYIVVVAFVWFEGKKVEEEKITEING